MPGTGGTFYHGAKSSIGATALQMTTLSWISIFGVLVKAADDNTGKAYVGRSSGVTAGTVDATDGIELGAGDAVLIEVDSTDKIWVIGSAAGQKVFWAAC